MDADPLELERRRIAKDGALGLGFDHRQADRLLFWRWLVRQRGETSHRAGPVERVVSSSWKYGLHVED
jgi:hypothetical protein